MGKVSRITRIDNARWNAFGKWLELHRGLKSISQAQVAAAIGVSRRQWIRYTQGAPVPRKRIPAIAKVIGISVGRALQRAGYETKKSGVDVNYYLGRIRYDILEGQLQEALFSLFDFYYEVAKEKKRYKPEITGVTAGNFVAAAIAIDNMPSWLRQEFIEYLWAIDHGGQKNDFPTPPEIRKKVRTEINKNLRKLPMVRGRLARFVRFKEELES